MAYAVLEAEITGKWGGLEASLKRADNAMRQFANTNRNINFKVNPSVFGQINNVRRMLGTIGTTNVDVQLLVNGVPAAMGAMSATAKGINDIGDEVDKTNAKVEILTRGIKDMGAAGSTRVGLNTKDLAGDVTPTRATRITPELNFPKGTEMSAIIAQVVRLGDEYEAMGIKAEGIRKVIPLLRSTLELQSGIDAKRNLKLDVSVNEKGVADVKSIRVLVDGVEASLTKAQERLAQLHKAGFGDEDDFARYKARVDASTKHFEQKSKDRAAAFRREVDQAQTEADRMRTIIGRMSRSGIVGDDLGRSMAGSMSAAELEKAEHQIKAVRSELARLDALTTQMRGAGAGALIPFVNSADNLTESIQRAERALIRLQGTQGKSSAWSLKASADKIAADARHYSRMGAPELSGQLRVGAGPEVAAEFQRVNSMVKNTKVSIDQANAAIARFESALHSLGREGVTVATALPAALRKTADEARNAESKVTALGERMPGLVAWAKQVYNTIVRWAVGYIVVSQLIAGVQALQNTIIGYNSTLEKAQIAFTTLMDGSSQRAEAFLRQLREFAKVTPFEFVDLVPLTQQMIAMGLVAENEVEKKAIPALTAIGNAAAAMGKGNEAIESIVRALGQMATKGKASAEEVTRQLAEVGVNGAQYIATAMGKSVSEVFDLMKKGAVDGKAAADAILFGMANDPKYKDMMAKYSQTFEGAMSNVKDSMRDIFAGAFLPIFLEVRDGLKRLADIMNTPAFAEAARLNVQRVIAVFSMLGRIIAYVAGVVGDKLPYIIAYLAILGGRALIAGIVAMGKALFTSGATAAAGWARANAVMIATIAIVFAFITAYRHFEEVQTITSETVLNVLLLFKRFSHMFGWLMGQIAGIIEKIGDLLGWIKRVPKEVMDVMDVTMPGTGGILKFLGGISDGMKQFGQDWQNMEVDSDKMFDEWIDGWIRSGSKKFKDLMTGDINGLLGITDLMAKINAEVAAGSKLPKLPALVQPKDLMRPTDDKGAAALKLYKDKLQDIAQQYEALAKQAEASAKRQLDALKSVRDVLRDIFGTMQDELAKFGIFNSPLDGIISRIEKLANLGPRMVSAVSTNLIKANAARAIALNAKERLDKLNGGDGSEPAYASKMTSTGGGARGSVAVSITPVDAAKASNSMLLQIAKSFTQGEPYYSCAFVASRLAKAVGLNVKPESRALALESQVKAKGWVPVDLNSLQRGDLIFNNRGGPNSGKGHVKMYAGNGQVINSNHREESAYNYRPKAGERAWRQSGGSGSLPGFMRGAGGKAVANAAAFGEGEGGNIVQEMVSLLNDLKITKLVPPPDEWGPVVKDAADNMMRYKVQMLLANEATQTLLRAALGDKGFAELASQLRIAANMSDAMLNSLRANAEAQTQLNDLAKVARLRGRDNDPFAQLDEEIGHGKYKALDLVKQQTLATATLRNVLDNNSQAVKDNVRASNDRLKVLEAGRAFITDATVNEVGYARAVEMRGKEVEYWTSVEVRALLRRADALEADAKAARADGATNGGTFMGRQRQIILQDEARRLQIQANTIRADLSRNASTLLGQFGTEYDAGKVEELRKSLALSRQELDRATASLQAQVPHLNNATLSETALNDAIESTVYYLQQLNRLRDEGRGDKEARALAAELTARNDNNRAMERQIELAREMRQVAAETARTVTLAQQKQAIYGSTGYGTMTQNRALADADAFSQLQKDIDAGKYDTTHKQTLGDKIYSITTRDLAAIATAREGIEKTADAEAALEVSANAASSVFEAQNSLAQTRNELIQQSLGLYGLLTDAGRAQMDLQLEIIRRQGTSNAMTEEELRLRKQVIELMREMPELQHQKDMQDARDKIASLDMPGTDTDRENFIKQRGIDRMIEQAARLPMVTQEWIYLQDAIRRAKEEMDMDEQVQKATDAAQLMQEAFDAFTGSLIDGFHTAYEASGSLFDRVLAGLGTMIQGIASYFLRLAEQILATYLMLKLFDAIMPGFAEFIMAVSSMGQGAGPGMGGILGALGGGGGGGSSSRSADTSRYAVGRGPGAGPGPDGGADSYSTGRYAVGSTSTAGGAAATVNVYNDFSGIRDSKEADSAAEKVGRQVSQAQDSRRSTAQNGADLVTFGSHNR